MPDDLIYHIVPRDDWLEAQANGSYKPPSLNSQGFIHCSTSDQVVDTANRFYHGQDGLVLLCIEVSRLRPPLRYEAPAMPGHTDAAAGQALFPHLYGPLDTSAVVSVLPFPSRADGTFALPPELRIPTANHNPVIQATQMTEETAQKLLTFLEQTDPVRRLRASQLASSLLGAVGFALFIVGIEQAAQDFPIVSNPYGSIAVGLSLLIVTGLLLRKLAGGE